MFTHPLQPLNHLKGFNLPRTNIVPPELKAQALVSAALTREGCVIIRLDQHCQHLIHKAVSVQLRMAGCLNNGLVGCDMGTSPSFNPHSLFSTRTAGDRQCSTLATSDATIKQITAETTNVLWRISLVCYITNMTTWNSELTWPI